MRVIDRYFHPLLFAIYPVCAIWLRNADIVAAEKFYYSLAISLLGVSLLYAVVRLCVNSVTNAALLTTALTFSFFSYGHAYTALYAKAINTEAAMVSNPTVAEDLHLFLAVLYLLLLLLFSRLLEKKILPAQALNRLCNIVGVLLLGFIALSFVFSGKGNDRTQNTSQLPEQTKAATEDLPDIYFFVLDGYARSDILNQHYNFDNSTFSKQLEQRGFSIATKSTVNYAWTMLSLASTLSMNYINDLTQMVGRRSQSRRETYRRLRDNTVSKILRRHGYRYVHMSSTWAGTKDNPYADETIRCPASLWSEPFYRTLLGTTALRVFETLYGDDLAACHLYNFNALEQREPGASPEFVFAHFILPHHPYLFDAEGQVLKGSTSSNQFEFQKKLWLQKEPYLDQMKFLNIRLLTLVDVLLAKRNKKPIIIIHSDHGPHFVPGESKANLRVLMANLGAYYLPNNTKTVPADMTAVNLFRWLLEHYLGEDLPLLPQKHYFSAFDAPYDFDEVQPFSASDPQGAH